MRTAWLAAVIWLTLDTVPLEDPAPPPCSLARQTAQAVTFDRFRDAEQNGRMIHSLACLDTEALFRSQAVSRFKNMERAARRKLLQIHAATELASLRVPPGNQLEALKGDRRGQHSIRINDQWRICFVWHDDGARQVEMVDYH